MARGGKQKPRKKGKGKPHDRPARKIKRSRAAAREAVEQEAAMVAGERATLEELKAEAEDVPAEIREQELGELIRQAERRVAGLEAALERRRAELAEGERIADDFLAAR